MDISHRARALRCILSGRVVSLCELQGDLWESRCGYAVIPFKHTILRMKLADRLKERFPRLARYIGDVKAEITSPANGVVTACGESFVTLRTGDGISVTVSFGTGLKALVDVGERLRCSTIICRTNSQVLAANGFDGAVAVYFPEPSQITELHVFAGNRLSPYRTAFYRTHR